MLWDNINRNVVCKSWEVTVLLYLTRMRFWLAFYLSSRTPHFDGASNLEHTQRKNSTNDKRTHEWEVIGSSPKASRNALWNLERKGK